MAGAVKNYRAAWRYYVPQFLFALEVLPYFTILTEIHYERVERRTMEVFSLEIWILRKRILNIDVFYREAR